MNTPAGRSRSHRRQRRLGCPLAALAALAVALLAHWAYWYRPRPHLMAPEDSVLLAGGSAAARVWIPYPHQNLGAAASALDDPAAVLAAGARLSGLPPPRVPRFPLFDRPPASELLVTTSADGRQVTAAIRLYPLPALLVRAAGAVAGNPWLAGGEVESGRRRGLVRWEGLTWRLEGLDAGHAGGPAGLPRQGSGLDRAGGPGELSRPLLAMLELAAGERGGAAAAPDSLLPAGRYLLEREGEDLVLRLGASNGDTVTRLRAIAAEGLVLLLARQREGRGEALLLLDREGGLLGGLPAAAAWAPPGRATGLLPAGELLASLRQVRVEPLADGELAATDGEGLARARELSSAWLPLVRGELVRGELARGEPAPAFALWLETARAARRARQLADVLDSLPLLPVAEEQRWRDAATLLDALRRYRRLTCWVAPERDAGELRLER